MNIRVVGRTHYITAAGPKDKLPVEVNYYFNKWGIAGDQASAAVVAYHNKKLVGFFRFFRCGDKALHASGTWVSKAFRRKKLAIKLWETAIRKEKACSIFVCTTSRGGHLLVKNVKKTFPNVKIDEDFLGFAG